MLLLILSGHVLEGYSSHFDRLSVCLSVADLEDDVHFVLQRDVPLIYHFLTIKPCS